MININHDRCKRLTEEIIQELDLDLTGLTVLTEAATNLFALTASIAAMAGAKSVLVVAKTSRFGSDADAIKETLNVAKQWEYENVIEVIDNLNSFQIASVDIVTNLAALRPLNRQFIEKLKPKAVIPLMFETWEFREEDLDIKACRENEILVLGTNEKHPSVDVLSYVGAIAIKLVLEAGVEVYKSKIVVLGSGDFANDSQRLLTSAGANVFVIPVSKKGFDTEKLKKQLKDADVLLIAEHICRLELIGRGARVQGKDIKSINPGVVIVHISGNVDQVDLKDEGVFMHPGEFAPAGYMTVTTAYVGPAPILRLHAAGLKVGQIMHESWKNNSSQDQALKQALSHPICQGFA